MSKWDSRQESYSPLRTFLDTNKLYLNGKLYNTKREDRNDNSQDKRYTQFNNDAYGAHNVQKQLLDAYANRLSGLNDFKGIYLDTRGVKGGGKGRWDHKNNNTTINLRNIREENPLDIINHELTHAASNVDTNLNTGHVEDYINNNFLKGKNPSKLLNSSNDYNNYENFIKNAQNTIDAGGGFSGKNRLKEEEQSTYDPYLLELSGHNKVNRLAGNGWRADEFNAHAIQNLHNPLLKSDDPQVNEYLGDVLTNQRNILNDRYDISKYPDINNAFDNRAKELGVDEIFGSNPSKQGLQNRPNMQQLQKNRQSLLDKSTLPPQIGRSQSLNPQLRQQFEQRADNQQQQLISDQRNRLTNNKEQFKQLGKQSQEQQQLNQMIQPQPSRGRGMLRAGAIQRGGIPNQAPRQIQQQMQFGRGSLLGLNPLQEKQPYQSSFQQQLPNIGGSNSQQNYGMGSFGQPRPNLTTNDLRNLMAGGVTEDQILGNQNQQRSSSPLEMIQPRSQQQQNPHQNQQFARGGRVNHAAESQRHRNNLRMIREYLERM